MCSMVAVVNNTLLCVGKLLRERTLRSLSQAKIIAAMGGDGC